MKGLKVIRNVLLVLAGLLFLLAIAAQLVLTPRNLTRIVNQVSASLLDDGLTFKEVRASVLRSFPYLNVTAEDCALTYPHARFAQFDSLIRDDGRRFNLLKAGLQRDSSAVPVDTLLSARKIVFSVDYAAYLSRKEIRLHHLKLQRPRIFAHYYDSTHANWDILPTGYSGVQKDTVQQQGSRALSIKKIELEDRPMIVFTNPADTLMGMFTLRRLVFDGDVDLQALERAEARLLVDTLFVSGRLPSDTVALGVERLQARLARRHLQLEADARASLFTRRYGRLRIPVHLQAAGDLQPREGKGPEVLLEQLGLRFASLELTAKGKLAQEDEGWWMNLDARVDDCPIGQLFDAYENNIPALKKLDTDARLSLDAHAEGLYGAGRLPEMTARLRVPPARVQLEGVERTGRLSLDADLSTRDYQEVDADFHRLFLDIAGARIDATATALDILGKDPVLSLDGSVRARVDSLARAFGRSMGLEGTGSLEGQVHGKARLSQLNMRDIGQANIDCRFTGSEIALSGTSDSLRAYIRRLDAELASKGNQIDRNLRKGARVLALKADIDTLDARWRGLGARGSEIQLRMQNAAEILKNKSGDLTSFMGMLKAARLRVKDFDGMSLSLRGSTELFRITPATKERPVPRLTLVAKNEAVRVRAGENFYSLRDLQFDVTALRHQQQPRLTQRREHLLDSLQKVYPDIPRDSLLRHARLSRTRQLSQDRFAASDVKISLSKALRDIVRQWDYRGKVSLASGRAALPSFPLRTGISDVSGSFSNDTLDLQRMTLRSGSSDLSAQARLSGLRWALLGLRRSHLKLDAQIQSDFIDASELMRGYAYHRTYVPKNKPGATNEDEEVTVDASALPDSAGRQLLVVPANLEVNLTLESRGIRYDSLLISWAAADIAMRDRTVQITNALAASNMGDLYFEGFYCTRSPEDIQTGFDLNMVDITAEKVITLFPAVDSILPMLTSFAGDLDCELTATARMDTCMNLILPSIDGVMRISGKDLMLKDSEEFSKIAKMLMFKDKDKATVDNMAVTGMVRDNVLEVFPFVLDVDRYMVAASGIQHFDESFNYHLSVIRSPMLFKFGLNAWGTRFDDIHYQLTTPLYKDANVPAFTRQLDTVQYSLVAAIHNVFELGVERAIAQNNQQRILQQRQEELGWQASTAPEGSASTESIRSFSGLVEDVTARLAGRREALREEIVRLEQEAALARKNEDAYEQ